MNRFNGINLTLEFHIDDSSNVSKEMAPAIAESVSAFLKVCEKYKMDSNQMEKLMNFLDAYIRIVVENLKERE